MTEVNQCGGCPVCVPLGLGKQHNPPIVCGIDLSLTSTGLATHGCTEVVRPKKLKSYSRLRYIRDAVFAFVEIRDPVLVVVEGPSYGSVGAGQHERGGLWHMVTEKIDLAGYPIAVMPPTNLKMYATGKGGGPESGKDKVLLAASRRFPYFEGGNDEADALWLAAAGYDYLECPIVAMPAHNREALLKVAWPE